MIPYLRIENLKNHTLSGGTYLDSPYIGVPPTGWNVDGFNSDSCISVLVYLLLILTVRGTRIPDVVFQFSLTGQFHRHVFHDKPVIKTFHLNALFFEK